MTFYAKPSSDLVYDLINKANPGLPLPLSAAVARLELPKTIAGAGPAALNTTIKASASRGQGYTGTKTLSYRRIDLSSFFKNTVAIVNKFKAGGQPVKFSDYLDDFNVRYGFSLTSDDFTDVNFPAVSIDPVDNRRTAAVVVNAKPNSLGFIGAFTFRWKESPQELKNIIVKPELPGRVYPPATFVNMLTYGGDNTAGLSAPVPGTPYKLMDYFADQLLFAGTARPDLLIGHSQFLNTVNSGYGTMFFADSSKPQSTPGNLFNAVIRIVTLPNALYPTANNNYKYLLVLQLQPGHTWGTGDLFFHHNYGV
jgi:hypothetical protein